MARILLIDDDDRLRASIGDRLKFSGHEVTVAENGHQGLKAFQDGTFDVVVTELLMPVMEGMETIRRIRAIDGAIPVIAMTGSFHIASHCASGPEPDYLQIAELLGATASIRKPFSVVSLLTLVDRCLAHRGPEETQ